MWIFKRRICPAGHLLDPSWPACPVCISPMRGWLVRLQSENADVVDAVYPLHQGKMKVGSGGDCEIRITRGNLGRHHALLKLDRGTCNVSDLGSEHSIQVNNRDVVNHTLIDGDILRLAEIEFKVKLI